MNELIKSIEKTLEQLLIDIPLRDMSKIEIKEVLVEILVVISEESENEQVKKSAQD